MSVKKYIVRKLMDFTHGWNSEIHQAIEQRVIAEHNQLFPAKEGDDFNERNMRINDMRMFYYSRMTTTASLLLAMASLVASIAALVIAL